MGFIYEGGKQIAYDNMRSYRFAYSVQKRNAKQRKIEWLFDFTTWVDMWIDSGHMHERGVKKGQYCMARTLDEGPYSKDNCYITLHSENAREPQVIEKIKDRDLSDTNVGEHLKDRMNHPRRKAVIDPTGKHFASASLAADAHGYSRRRIAQLCTAEEKGWKYN